MRKKKRNADLRSLRMTFRDRQTGRGDPAPTGKHNVESGYFYKPIAPLELFRPGKKPDLQLLIVEYGNSTYRNGNLAGVQEILGDGETPPLRGN